MNHFSTQGASGGPVGIINADFIRSVDFYASSFPASKYNALSGILSFRQKDGNKEKTNFWATLGASETALTLDGPLGEKTNYIFSLRRSYLQFLFAQLDLPFLPTYNDYQVRLKTNIDSKNTITIISLGSLDKLALNKDIDDPDASQEFILSQIPTNNQWSYTIGGVYKHFFDQGLHSLVLSRNKLNNQLFKYPNNDESLEKSFDYQSQETENKLRYELSTKKAGIKYSFSTNFEYALYSNRTNQQIFSNNILTNLKYSTDLDILKYGLSGQASKRFLKSKLIVTAGIRFDGNNYNDNTKNILNQTSPRASASYTLTPKSAFNIGLGRFYQQAAYTTLGFKGRNGNLVNQNNAKFHWVRPI